MAQNNPTCNIILDPSNFDEFCNKFLKENVAVVKVEMATKSLTRSLKDKRFNFVSQLSSLGKNKNFPILILGT